MRSHAPTAGCIGDSARSRMPVRGPARRTEALAGPAAGGLRSLVEKGVVLVLQQPRVQELWKSADEVTHRQFVNLIENKSSVIRTPGGGAVYLDPRPIVAELAKRLGAPSSTAEKIPAKD